MKMQLRYTVIVPGTANLAKYTLKKVLVLFSKLTSRRSAALFCIAYVFYIYLCYLISPDVIPLKNRNTLSSKNGLRQHVDFENNSNETIFSGIDMLQNIELSVSKTRHKLKRSKPWFMKKGEIRPYPSPYCQNLPIWPEEHKGDRIVEQLMYYPKSDIETRKVLSNSYFPTFQHSTQKRTILLYFGQEHWNIVPGQYVFVRDSCPIDSCHLSYNYSIAESADAILFKDTFFKPAHQRHPNQVWILHLLESPYNSISLQGLRNIFNWTATYRHDSDIVTPYEKYVPYALDKEKALANKSKRNYAAGKTKKVAWFVSNCNTINRRMTYAVRLSQYIDVDIFGSCARLKCSKSSKRCFKMLERDYKFYLAFENSNCRDYITEKFFVNGLSHDIVPIVMGAHPDDYARSAPEHSYIHVDNFSSPKKLAEYLIELDSNDTLYNEYFAWKGQGEFINTYFWCRICAMLHAPRRHKSYQDIEKWWFGNGVCVERGKWKNDRVDLTKK